MLISLERRQCVSAAAAMLCSRNSNYSSPLLPPQKLRCWAKNHFSSLESHKCLSGKLFSHEINARTNTRTLPPSLLPSLLHTRTIKNGSIWTLWSLLKCHNCCLLLTFKQMKCEKSITHTISKRFYYSIFQITSAHACEGTWRIWFSFFRWFLMFRRYSEEISKIHSNFEWKAWKQKKTQTHAPNAVLMAKNEIIMCAVFWMRSMLMFLSLRCR